ncbi:MAG: hypothetical protein CM15mP107_4060 [Bacteroidota bacterium]|nr:MAG: hypothetical protein CM15mP107_4060 [Bacteroidota bacterium]
MKFLVIIDSNDGLCGGRDISNFQLFILMFVCHWELYFSNN